MMPCEFGPLGRLHPPQATHGDRREKVWKTRRLVRKACNPLIRLETAKIILGTACRRKRRIWKNLTRKKKYLATSTAFAPADLEENWAAVKGAFGFVAALAVIASRRRGDPAAPRHRGRRWTRRWKLPPLLSGEMRSITPRLGRHASLAMTAKGSLGTPSRVAPTEVGDCGYGGGDIRPAPPARLRLG